MTRNPNTAARRSKDKRADGASAMPKALGAAVKMRRSERKMTQVQLASKLAEIVDGVNQSYVSQLERGELYPGSERLSALLHVLDCTAAELWAMAEELADGNLDDQSRESLLELLDESEFGFSYEQRAKFDHGSDPIVQKRLEDILDRVSIRSRHGRSVTKEDLKTFIEAASEIPMPKVFLKLVHVLYEYLETYACEPAR